MFALKEWGRARPLERCPDQSDMEPPLSDFMAQSYILNTLDEKTHGKALALSLAQSRLTINCLFPLLSCVPSRAHPPNSVRVMDVKISDPSIKVEVVPKDWGQS